MVKFKVPATTANLGPGFDTLGMALSLYNQVEMEEKDEGLLIEVRGEGEGFIPEDKTNIVYRAAQKVFSYQGISPSGLFIKLNNRIPIARGLGSSAAAIVGGLSAANRLTGSNLSDQELLSLGLQVEGHPDNITPALLGGFTISCLEDDQVVYVKAAPPENLKAVVVIPDFLVPTTKARSVLPDTVSLEDAVFNVSHASLVVASLMAGEIDLLDRAMKDRLHQPYRFGLIPGAEDVFSAAKEAGARAVVISGSGPTIIALGTGDMEKVGKAMNRAFLDHDIPNEMVQTIINQAGAEEIKPSDSDEAVAQ